MISKEIKSISEASIQQLLQDIPAVLPSDAQTEHDHIPVGWDVRRSSEESQYKLPTAPPPEDDQQPEDWEVRYSTEGLRYYANRRHRVTTWYGHKRAANIIVRMKVVGEKPEEG